MDPRIGRRFGGAALVIAIADLGVVAWGSLAAVDPSVLTAGFETYTSTSWDGFATGNERVAGFILVGFRLVGALNVALGLILLAVAVMAFRRGDRWAWWALLIGNTLTIGAPIVYDRVVGFIGPFEALEYLALLAVYAALVVTAPMLRGPRERAAADTGQVGGTRP